MQRTNANIYIIVAMTRDHIIGNDNIVPWHIKDELQTFKRLTTGNIIIMGRNTYESIGRVLPNRINILISNKIHNVIGAEVYSNLSEAIERAKQFNKNIFCIGGREIYKEALLFADFMYISWINGNYNGNIKFPEYDAGNWDLKEELKYNEFRLSLYQRKGYKNNSDIIMS